MVIKATCKESTVTIEVDTSNMPAGTHKFSLDFVDGEAFVREEDVGAIPVTVHIAPNEGPSDGEIYAAYSRRFEDPALRTALIEYILDVEDILRDDEA